MDQDLTIQADGSVLLRGSEGVTLDGKTVSISSEDHVNLTTVSFKVLFNYATENCYSQLLGDARHLSHSITSLQQLINSLSSVLSVQGLV